MKKLLCTLGLAVCSASLFAQTSQHKLGITIGGGPLDYKGDLGNSFNISTYDVWRGGLSFQASYYLNKSLDVSAFGMGGDLGHCQSFDVITTPIENDDRCPGCIGRVGLGNLSSRIYTVGLSAKYKFANGYLLNEKSRIKPYIYAGAAINRLSDQMKMNCVNVGDYLTINAGLGANYYITERLNVGYNLSFGYFTEDKVDFMSHGGTNDMYMQNALTVGIDLF